MIKKYWNSVYPENASWDLTRVKKFIKGKSNTLAREWVISGRKNFNLYHDERYFYELFICFMTISYHCTNGVMKFLMEEFPRKYKNFSYYDDFNGIGLTTLRLMHHGISDLNIRWDNSVPIQRRMFDVLCGHFGFEKPKRIRGYKVEYDVVMSFENIEHFERPLEYINKLENIVAKKGFLCVSTTFDPKYCGHFSEYIIDGEKVDAKRAGRLVNKYLKTKFKRVFKGFNARPVIYRAT